MLLMLMIIAVRVCVLLFGTSDHGKSDAAADGI
jgi:hypothetical protein